MSEVDLVKERYARRRERDSTWDNLAPHHYLAMQEKQRALIRWMSSCGIPPLAERRLLDIGCGTGGDLLSLIGLGFDPVNLVGCELLEDRAEEARRRLPSAVRLVCGDALEAPLETEAFDVVMQSTVFTSLLDATFQRRLAARMWSLARPGGGILWFDFVYDNPRNPDVRGVPQARVRELFPHGEMVCRRVTLAPPIARRVARISPSLYAALDLLPFLRTHILCWISK